MLAVTFADLLFRARQFAIAVVGVGLVLALALSLSGLADGFRAETSATVNGFGASSWVMSRSARGSVIALGRSLQPTHPRWRESPVSTARHRCS